jgi:hypothetical protein
MRSLLAFGNGGSGGGSGFPGSPVAGVYFVTDATIDAVAASVLAIPSSVVLNTDKGATWYADGTGMTLLAVSTDFGLLPLPTTSGGVVYSVPEFSVGFDLDGDKVCYFDGTDWISTGQP